MYMYVLYRRLEGYIPMPIGEIIYNKRINLLLKEDDYRRLKAIVSEEEGGISLSAFLRGIVVRELNFRERYATQLQEREKQADG